MASVTYQDYPEAALIILWGVNPSTSGIHLVPYVREAQKRGAKLVVVDPARRPLARSADVHLPVKPGTDVAVALAIHRYLFANGYADEAFLHEHARVRERLRERAESGRSTARRRPLPVSTPPRSSSVAELYADTLAGAGAVWMGPRTQPQRRQRRDGGAGATGGRRQVRRARRRLFDEQLGVVEHRSAVDRRGGARHASRQHEPSRARADRVRRSAGQGAVRLQLQSRRRRCPISSASSAASSARTCSRSSSSR